MRYLRKVLMVFFVCLCIVGFGLRGAVAQFEEEEFDILEETTPAAASDDAMFSSEDDAVSDDMAFAEETAIIGEEGEGLISLDFQNAPIGAVLRVLSDQTGINFILDETLREKLITIYLNKVTPDEAITSLVKANRLVLEKTGSEDSKIFIVRESGVPKVPLETRTYTLNYLPVADQEIKYNLGEEEITGAEDTRKKTSGKADQIVKIQGAGTIIKEMLSARGKYVLDTRTNTVVVTDIPANLAKIEEILTQLDVRTPQVMIEAEILETSSDLLKEFGLRWGTGDSGTMFRIAGAQRATHWPFTKFLPNIGDNTTSAGARTMTIPDLLNLEDYTSTATPMHGVVSFVELQVALDAIERNTKSKVLARPKVLTLNNYPALIEISADTAIAEIQDTTSSEGIASQITKPERTKTGIVLKVIPQINRHGYITMTVQPKVIIPVASRFFDEIVDPHKRSVDAKVMIKDGETLIIGGLLSTEDSDVVRKVPILGDVPLLGHAFRHKGRDKEDRDLVIFITPHIIKDIEPAVNLGNGQTQLSRAQTTTSGASSQPKMILREQAMGNRDEAIAETVKNLNKV